MESVSQSLNKVKTRAQQIASIGHKNLYFTEKKTINNN